MGDVEMIGKARGLNVTVTTAKHHGQDYVLLQVAGRTVAAIRESTGVKGAVTVQCGKTSSTFRVMADGGEIVPDDSVLGRIEPDKANAGD